MAKAFAMSLKLNPFNDELLFLLRYHGVADYREKDIYEAFSKSPNIN
jgi:hypothetical protein